MTLRKYLNKHGGTMGFLEETFLRTVFFKDYGEEGLDLIRPEVVIDRNDGSGRKWRIDFVIETSYRKYAIETDGFNYHAPGMVSRERFDELTAKSNEVTRQGYIQINLSRDQITQNPDDAIFELRRTFNADKQLYSIFLGWNKGLISPHQVQEQALRSLSKTREEKNDRGLVSLATGLGKTFLSIFDVLQTQSERVLFVVHVEHILKQAKNSFEKVMPDKSNELGFFTGKDRSFEDKNIIFATIQTINKKKNLEEFSPTHFDYIVMDEAHHTAAETYRKVLEYFKPKFFLGLTATPQRSDKQDILQFYNNNLVFEMDQTEAIRQGYLASLNYKGFKDNVDYSNIYYSGFKYDIQDLNKLLMIKKRDAAVISKFRELAHTKKTIGFCVSIDHADWCAEQFRDAGYDAVAIHSKIENNYSSSAYQSAAEIIDAFDNDQHQIVFVVDMLNEGIDIPNVECLLMLRPTESNTILTQQIGRGLRIAHGKDEILVLDFIGNYKSAPQILSGLGVGVGQLKERDGKDIFFYENDGKSVEFDSEVVDIFRMMTSRSTRTARRHLISEEWADYGEYISDCTEEGNNLYWSIGKKNNNMGSQIWALSFLYDNSHKFVLNKDLDATLKHTAKNNPDIGSMEGIRAMFFSKILGLLESTNPMRFSDAYEVVRTGSPEEVSSQISDQFEKYYFFNDIFSVVNRHDTDGKRREFSKIFHIYPIFFLYQVLVRLHEKGYEKMHLSKFEIENFIVLARSHGDLEEVVERIISYREYDEIYELKKHLRERSTMDTRFFKALSNIQYFIFQPDSISVSPDAIDDLYNKVMSFNIILNEGVLIRYKEGAKDKYREMLYSRKSLIDFHLDH